MTELTFQETEKVMKVIEDLSSVYWREIFATAIPQFERGKPVRDQLRRARDKLNEVVGP
jgi:hypothetical protein